MPLDLGLKVFDVPSGYHANVSAMCLIEVISIFNAAVAAMLVAHIITCLWFWIGMTVQDSAKKPSKGSHQRILQSHEPL